MFGISVSASKRTYNRIRTALLALVARYAASPIRRECYISILEAHEPYGR